ncbi:LruC domain-containing protein [Pedobacter sp. SYP-B3415]|uniref:LruC domain-containing protein n=1 Tax=Pedobacter sp. SYP-B3415 TaxID=2496641 RepID=UPI001F100158|nr:LruC domain-containing protein [Pedobacter sp. SYP-B3415]
MKKTLQKSALALLLIGGLISGCKKSDGITAPEPEQTGSNVPSTFSYQTSRQVQFDIRLLSNNNQPIKGALVSVTATDNADKIFFKGVSDASGHVRGTVDVPNYLDSVAVLPKYTGLLNKVKSVIKNKSSISMVIGGADGLSGDVVISNEANTATGATMTGKQGNIIAGILGTDYVYPSPYTSSAGAIVNTTEFPFALGRPKYLLGTSDDIDASLLSYINASLPEGKPLTQTHPEYLTSTAQSNIVVTQNNTEIFITFVSEGADYKNTLGWYSYPTNNPPSQATGSTLENAIDKVTMVFPNASAYGSGGGLKPGNKVSLGKFNAGTTIALVLIQNAWTSNGIQTGNTKFYTDSKFNPESTTALRKHSVMLYDDQHDLFVLGFEDVNRTAGSGSDNDFNDLVVYATATPSTAVSKTNVSTIDTRVDSDNDGVDDTADEFPNDPTRAYTSYYPSKTGWATLAFEDNWPNTGDFDVNDLVVNYRYKYVSNAANNVVEMTGSYLPVAAGADYNNGFGVQLPVAASAVTSVTGQNLKNGYISLAANGVEAGQAKAVIIPFDNHENLLKNADGTPQVNTVPGKAKVAGTQVDVTVLFTSPVAQGTLVNTAINPFLISNKRRGYEVHLSNYAPTDKADKTLFRTGADNSVPASNRYYMDANNAPWALNFPDAFAYPTEAKSIKTAYLNFDAWAKSGGTQFTDWYISTAAGYRNDSNLFK